MKNRRSVAVVGVRSLVGGRGRPAMSCRYRVSLERNDALEDAFDTNVLARRQVDADGPIQPIRIAAIEPEPLDDLGALVEKPLDVIDAPAPAGIDRGVADVDGLVGAVDERPEVVVLDPHHLRRFHDAQGIDRVGQMPAQFAELSANLVLRLLAVGVAIR